MPIAAALSSCVATGVQPLALEQSVALVALADELALGPRRDTIYLLNRLSGTTTQAPDSALWLERLLPTRFMARVPPTLFYRYWAANQASAPLSLSRFDRIAGRPVRWISDLREPTIRSATGAYSLSRIGFSPTADSALVEVSFACRGLCGSENLYLYLKGPTGWHRHRNLRSMVH
jgi:hypothetical protein